MRLVAKNAPDRELEDDLRSTEEFKRALAVGLLMLHRGIAPTQALTLAELQRRLPTVAQTDQGAIDSLLAYLQLGLPDLIDLDSLTAEEAVAPDHSRDFPVSVIDMQARQLFKSDWIPSGQGDMHFVIMLPESVGVELRGKHVSKYHAATAALAAIEKRAAGISQCKKLLVDLPVALENSQAALAIRSRAADVDSIELGVMVIEQ